MKRTHRSLQLLVFAVTLKEEDSFFYCEWTQLKKYLSRVELKKIIQTVRENPSCYSDEGKTWLLTEDNGYVHTVQWSF